MATAFADAIERPFGTNSPDEGRGVLYESTETHFIDPRSDETWNSLVLKHPEHTFFHSAAWAQVLCDSYDHKPFYLQLREHGKLLALVPLLEVNSRLTGRRGVCLPFSDHCGPLLFGQSAGGVLKKKLSEIARTKKWKYVELRGTDGMWNAHSHEPTFYIHQLDLKPGIDAVLRGFDASARRALRKAERSQLTVQISDTRESVAEFFHLHEQTRRRHGVPPQSTHFFSNIHGAVLRPGLGFVVQARWGSRPIAGAMFFHFGNRAIYKFGASDERYNLLRGNNLVMWEGIKEVARRGAHSLHFGRTACQNHGLRRYKRAWGSKEEPVSYLRLHVPSETWATIDGHVSPLHERLFRQMPLAMNRLAGTLLYRHLH